MEYEDFDPNEPQSNAPIQWAVLQDIPREFLSVETGEPLSNCLVCEKYLLDDGTQYMVEKAMRRHPKIGSENTLFEMAICMDCAIKQREELSRESLEAMDNWMMANMKAGNRTAHDLFETTTSHKWLQECSVNGTALEEETEYQMFGLCNGKQMVFGQLPYVLGSQAIEELQELLSDATRDEMNGFAETYFGLPPELADLFKDRPVLVM